MAAVIVPTVGKEREEEKTESDDKNFTPPTLLPIQFRPCSFLSPEYIENWS